LFPAVKQKSHNSSTATTQFNLNHKDDHLLGQVLAILLTLQLVVNKS